LHWWSGHNPLLALGERQAWPETKRRHPCSITPRCSPSIAVIAALTNGRVSVSANPFAPRVELYADRDGDGAMGMMMGDNAISPGASVKFRAQLSGTVVADATYTVKVVKDGAAFGTFETKGSSPMVDFADTPAAGVRSYYRVTVEGPPTAYPQVPDSMVRSENMDGLSNPIYFNFDPTF
jgi:hypothetical protein